MMKNIVMLFFVITVICSVAKAQVTPFTRTYDIYPDQTGEDLMSMEKTHDNG